MTRPPLEAATRSQRGYFVCWAARASSYRMCENGLKSLVPPATPRRLSCAIKTDRRSLIFISRMSRGADRPPSCSPRMRRGGLLWREPEAISLSSDEAGDYRSRQKIFGQSQTRFDADISPRGLPDLDC